MSVIHWHKSVVSLHLKEIFEDHQRENASAVNGFGAVMLGAIALYATAELGKPLFKKVIKKTLALNITNRAKAGSVNSGLGASHSKPLHP